MLHKGKKGGAKYIGSQVKAVTGTEGKLGDLTANKAYILTSTVDAWFAIGASPTAAARTADNHLIVAGQERLITVPNAAWDIHIIKDTAAADGYACLSEVDQA